MERQFSEEDAREILALAAERDHLAKTAARTTLTLAELEDAARTAGIDPAHVRSAAADVLRPERRASRRTFWGLPVELRQTRILTGHVGDADWESIVGQCRQTFGRQGVVSDLGSTREWASKANERNSPVRVICEQEGPNTRLTIEQRTWPNAIGTAIGTGMNVATGLLLFLMWLLSGASNGLWIAALVPLLFSVLFGIGAVTKLRRDDRQQAEAFDRVLTHAERLLPVAPTSPEATLLLTETPLLNMDTAPAQEQDSTPQARRVRN